MKQKRIENKKKFIHSFIYSFMAFVSFTHSFIHSCRDYTFPTGDTTVRSHRRSTQKICFVKYHYRRCVCVKQQPSECVVLYYTHRHWLKVSPKLTAWLTDWLTDRLWSCFDIRSQTWRGREQRIATCRNAGPDNAPYQNAWIKIESLKKVKKDDQPSAGFGMKEG